VSPPTLSPLSPKEKKRKRKIAIFNLVQNSKCHGRPFILHIVNQCVLMILNHLSYLSQLKAQKFANCFCPCGFRWAPIHIFIYIYICLAVISIKGIIQTYPTSLHFTNFN
jgi:hypothetical protein